MVGVKCMSIAIVASSTLPTDPSPSNLKPKTQTTLKQNQRKLSVTEIERAIGAGIFRDRDTTRRAEESKTLFDSNSVEGDVEKKLRLTGEWLIDKTENTSASAGKQILIVVFQWILPMWILAFLLASGMLKLQFLDDLLL